MHNVVKWPNILQKSCGVNTARFLKYVRPFYNIMYERVNQSLLALAWNILAGSAVLSILFTHFRPLFHFYTP